MAQWRCRELVVDDRNSMIDDRNSSSENRLTMGAERDGGQKPLTGPGSDVMLAEPKTKTKRPPMYKVILLNDDYTPMDFVVSVLEQIFRRSHEEALQIMLEVHQKGSGLAGVYTRDVAETKVEQVIGLARKNEHPLQCVMEKE